MKTVTEGKQTFSFPDDWYVVKYDDTNFYRKSVEKCADTKAVDILALSDTDMWMIEAKDFRSYRIDNKERIANHDLVDEFARKVRDTIAGLYGAHRSTTEQLSCFCNHLFPSVAKKINVILFLEEDRPSEKHKSFKRARSNMKKAVEKHLKFLNVRCNILNRQELTAHLNWSVL